MKNAKKLSDLAVGVFCENMAMMLAAGIGPDEAVGLLGRDSDEQGELNPAARAVAAELDKGKVLSAALRDSGWFPAYAADMTAAGEQTGRTEQVLRTLADFYQKQDALERKLKSAVVYPAVLLLLMAVILIVLVARLLPVFFGVYTSLAGNLADSSFGYIRFAGVVGWAALVVTGMIAVALLAGWLAGRTPGGRAFLSRLFEKLPLTAGASRQLAVARFTQVLAIFIASGVDVDTSVTAASGMVENGAVQTRLGAMRQAMAGGKGLATAIYDCGLYEPLYGRMLLSGARSGQAEQVLARLAAIFSEEADRRLDTLMDTIEPLLSGFLTVAVGVTLLSVMLPLVGILGAIG